MIFGRFSSSHGQCSVTAAWATPSPWSISYFGFRESVVFKDTDAGDEYMKGIDVTGPPSLPKHFRVKRGGMANVLVGSDTENDDDDEMNNGMVEEAGPSSDVVGEDGDT